MADAVDLAYAAGIIDGEGYIGITTQAAAPGRSPQFQAVVNVGMADPEIPLWLAENFGGAVYSYPPRGTGRGVHHWRLTGPATTEFCRMIRPYLRLKHRQAETVVRYREDARLSHRRGVRGQPTPPEEIALKHEYASAIKSMNQRSAVS